MKGKYPCSQLLITLLKLVRSQSNSKRKKLGSLFLEHVFVKVRLPEEIVVVHKSSYIIFLLLFIYVILLMERDEQHQCSPMMLMMRCSLCCGIIIPHLNLTLKGVKVKCVKVKLKSNWNTTVTNIDA